MAGDVFSGVVKGAPRKAGAFEVSLPILYHRQDSFFAIHGADAAAVRRLLPSPRLKPIPVWPGRLAVSLNAFNYLETDIGPYGEFSVGVPCVVSHQGSLVPGVYVHRLPVTTEIARSGGIEFWGYPKFLCAMDFKIEAAVNRVKLVRDDRLILDWRVSKRGLGMSLSQTVRTFTVKDGRLIMTTLSAQGLVRVSVHGLAALELGPDEMGEELRSLYLSDRPLVTGDLLDLKVVLPEGEDLGPI